MSAVAPFNSLHQWRSSLYRGRPANVDRFLDTINATLPADWSRDVLYEQTLARPARHRCYLFDRGGHGSVRVWLDRVTTTRVRGGPVQVLRHPPAGNAGQLDDLVAAFADACVIPAGSITGLRHTRPEFGARSAVTPPAEMLFTQFADTADGEWPLSACLESLWYELVSVCLTEQVAIDRHELARWIFESGWEQQVVTTIVERFFSDSGWLSERLAAAAT